MIDGCLYTSHNTRATPDQIIQLFPKEIVAHIAGYCLPKEKDNLKKVCQSFYKGFQDKEAILLDNPSNVTLSHKIKKMFEYSRSGDAKKLSSWLSVLEAADINQTCSGETPLYSASQNGHAEVVQLLLKASADVNQAWTPLCE